MIKLNIATVAAPRKNIPFVFFLFEGEVLSGQPLFEFLIADEKQYVEQIKKDFTVPKEKEARVLFMPVTRRKVILVGMGEQAGFSAWKAGLAMRVAVQAARKEKFTDFAFFASPFETQLGAPEATRELYEVVASNAVMANFEFVAYKTPPPEGFIFLKEIQAVTPGALGKKAEAKNDTKNRDDITAGLERGIIIGEEVNRCRDLANTPGGDMTPALLVEHALRAIKGLPVRATILDEKKMKSLGMGGVLGVGKGSVVPPRFIVLEYMGAEKTGVRGAGAAKSPPIVLAGKGVTFDSGGINLKPGDAAYEMHMDMSGGAAVIHAIVAAARLRVKKNIVALVPAVENMVSGASYRPGDLLRTMNGKTIEVLNTDAEGRVILADALEYAKKYDPAVVVDVATLTGAAIAALGLRYSGLFTPSKSLEEQFRAIGGAVGDPVWPLPLSKDYEDDIRGTFGDWANTGKKGAGGGASTAATFLWQFTKDAAGNDSYQWVHLDIAPRMTSIDGEYLAKGAAGAPVRLLVRFLGG
jgi:leucyl aminopeptidase